MEIASKTDVRSGAVFGETGAYERIIGKIYFAVDPKLAPNRIIADIDLAPKNHDGLVEFSADLYIFRPKIPAHANGTALVHISNRGGRSYNFAQSVNEALAAETEGDRFLFERGFTVVWVGWEFDIPPDRDLLRAYLPIATDHGKTITGVVRSEWTGDAPETTIPLGDRGQLGYPVLDPNSPNNKLFVRDTVTGPRTSIPHSDWKFSDSTHVTLDPEFTPGRIYEVVYETKDPPVAGLGLAAVRDFVSFLKYGGAPTALGDEHDSIKRAIGFGVSQSGRFLREFLYDGFNEDERHRQVFDAVWAHVAGAGRGSFNERFAQPSRDGHPFLNVFYPVDMPPFDDLHLLERSRRAHVVPKLFLTNGGYEYWGRCASLIHTTEDGRADLTPSATTRIYFFSSTQHFGGAIPPLSAPTQNLTNPIDYRHGLRALLVALENWLSTGVEPPPSQFPHFSKAELTTPAALNFPGIPGVETPRRQRKAYRLDFSTEPPRVGPPFETFVPQVDADGIDLGGIRMPEIAVPLATYTGWNLRASSIGAPAEILSFFGSWIPLARTPEERTRRRDPRSSIAERYSGEQQYIEKIDEASENLVRAGYLLEIDRSVIRERAAKEWAYRQSLK